MLRPCQSVKIEADKLVNSELLTCKVTIDKDDGSVPSEYQYRGEMSTATTVSCSTPDLLTLGNPTTPIIYNYTISLSNNQQNYSTVPSNDTRLVWHSDWYWPTCVEQGKFLPKMESCVIDGECMTSGTVNPADDCLICIPVNSTTDWTKEIDEDTNLTPWSEWTTCTKPCDYGLHNRSRECTSTECCGYGALYEHELCNEFNCQDEEEQRSEGVIVHVTPVSMLEMVQRETTFNVIVTDLVNVHIKDTTHTEFCEALDLQPLPSAPNPGYILTESDTFWAASYPRETPQPDNITTKVIIWLDVTRVESFCVIDGITGHRMLDGSYMMAALPPLEQQLEEVWGHDLTVVMELPPGGSTRTKPRRRTPHQDKRRYRGYRSRAHQNKVNKPLHKKGAGGHG